MKWDGDETRGDGVEDLPDLPPIDEDPDEPDRDSPTVEDLSTPDDGEPGDDAVAPELDIGELIDEAPAADGDDESEFGLELSGELVGELEGVAGLDDSENAADIEELDGSFDAPAGDDGEEGTSDALEELSSDDLPAMDADEDGEFEVVMLRDEERRVSGPSSELPPWADRLWHEQDGFSLPLPSGGDRDASVVVCGEAQTVVIASARDGVFVARRAKPVEACPSFRRFIDDPASVESAVRVHAAVGIFDGSPRVWLCASTGHVLEGDNFGSGFRSFARIAPQAVAIASRVDGTLDILCEDSSGLSIHSSRDGVRWDRTRVTPPADWNAAGGVFLLRSGANIAVGARAGILVSRDDGARFELLPGTRGAIAGAFSGAKDSPAVVFASSFEDTPSWLCRARGDGRVERLADLSGGSESETRDPRPLGLAWDLGRELAWIWSNGRLAAWGPKLLQ